MENYDLSGLPGCGKTSGSTRQYRWGPDGPPPEAYSRVTDPDRFAPLHEFAGKLLGTLESAFHVERREGYDLDPDADPTDLARPSVRLTPHLALAAPLQLTFTTFPGLLVRAGRWHHEPIPACGCDACDETADSAIEELCFLVEQIVAGRFREELRLSRLSGSAWLLREFGGRDVGASRSGKTRMTRAGARQLLGTGPRKYDWKPWPRR
jgi:hypothetical protein